MYYRQQTGSLLYIMALLLYKDGGDGVRFFLMLIRCIYVK